jgi:hypothetical protein
MWVEVSVSSLLPPILFCIFPITQKHWLMDNLLQQKETFWEPEDDDWGPWKKLAIMALIVLFVIWVCS